jgi:hypothetical protein
MSSMYGERVNDPALALTIPFVSLVYIELTAGDVHFSPYIVLVKSYFYACIKFDFGYALTYWPARPFAIRSRPGG